MKINNSIIRIVGLLGDFNKKNTRQQYQEFIKSGYIRDLLTVEYATEAEERSKRFFKNTFYPEFRDMMYLGRTDSEEKRFAKTQNLKVNLKYGTTDRQRDYFLNILKSEIYVFEGHISLFSISINIDPNNDSLEFDSQKASNVSIDDASNVTSLIRNFNTSINFEGKTYAWSQWISEFILCGIELESKDGNVVKADEFSGSKFKIFSVYDIDQMPDNNLLFELGTCSPIGSSSVDSTSFLKPHETYFLSVIKKNKITVFQNWEAICLFDSFTCLGSGQLFNDNYKSWDQTYFRIYLYRLFFKYNLYRYNSEIFEDKHSVVKVRDQFVDFLNRYEISHISFNFLPNEIYSKIGKALELEVELEKFKTRITNLSNTIQEERESKTNILLQIVTVLGGISSVGPILEGVEHFKTQIGLSSFVFYAISVVLMLFLAIGVLYFIVPHELKKVWKKIKSIFR